MKRFQLQRIKSSLSLSYKFLPLFEKLCAQKNQAKDGDAIFSATSF